MDVVIWKHGCSKTATRTMYSVRILAKRHVWNPNWSFLASSRGCRCDYVHVNKQWCALLEADRFEYCFDLFCLFELHRNISDGRLDDDRTD